MPELPEVETVIRQLQKKMRQQQITAVDVRVEKMAKPSPTVYSQQVVGQRLAGIQRHAKYILMSLSDHGYLVFHLKLNGRLFWRQKSDAEDKYTHLILFLDDGSELRFADSRKFAYSEYIPTDDDLKDLLATVGPDALTIDPKTFYHVLQGTSRKIKVVMMDQQLIAGVGNIYANDALWLAKIHPATPANQISKPRSRELLDAMKTVLNESLEKGGASDQWFLHIDGGKGAYQESFKVYGRKGEFCRRHPKQRIEYLKIGQRGSFICPKCQRL